MTDNCLRRSKRTKSVNKAIFNEDFVTQHKMSDESADDTCIDVDIPTEDGALEAELVRLEEEASKKQEELKKVTEKDERVQRVLAMRKDINRMEKEIEQKKRATKSKKTPSRTKKGAPGLGLSESCDGDVEENSGAVGGGKQAQPQVRQKQTLKEIRKSCKAKEIRSSVNAKLNQINQLFDTDSDTDVEQENGGKFCINQTLVGGKKSRNGKVKHEEDDHDPIFPNEVLGPQHAVKPGKRQVGYQDLNLRLLCLGEALICASGDLTAEEVQGRLFWLSNLLTYAKSYKFSAILTLHEEMIVQVHRGQRTWYTDHASLAAQIVIPHPIVVEEKKAWKGDKNNDKKFTYFCGKYNSAEGCTESDRHSMNFKGETVTAHHICASCLIRDKKQKSHPQGGDDCPYRK